MSILRKLRTRKQQGIEKRLTQTDSYQFFNLLTGPELLSTVESLLPAHRERLFPPTETLSMFLAQALRTDRSCQQAVNDAAIKRLVGGLPQCSTATGGYCRARQRLPLNLIRTLTQRSAALMDTCIPGHWRWRDRAVRLIDGTTVTMPDTRANQAVYPQMSSQQPGAGFPIGRMVGVICLSSGALLNAAIGPYQGKGTSEQDLVRGLLDTFKDKDLIVGDAYYGTYFFLAALLAKGCDAVFEQMGTRKRTTDFRCGKRLGAKDHLVTYHKPKHKPDWMSATHYAAAPESLVIRELQVKGKILITTLRSPNAVSKRDLGALYRSRWQIELNLRHIKTTLGMETLSCKSPDMIEKEIWVYFLAYNLIRLLMAQAAVLADRLPRQMSFKHTLQLWLVWNQQTYAGNSKAFEEQLFMLIAQVHVGNRPGRIEPRAVKRRPKQYALLSIPREQARMKIRDTFAQTMA